MVGPLETCNDDIQYAQVTIERYIYKVGKYGRSISLTKWTKLNNPTKYSSGNYERPYMVIFKYFCSDNIYIYIDAATWLVYFFHSIEASSRSSSHQVVVLYPTRKKSRAPPSVRGKTPSCRRASVSSSLNCPRPGRMGLPPRRL